MSGATSREEELDGLVGSPPRIGELLDRARAGDRVAMGQVFEKHTDFLLRRITKLMGSALRRTIEPEDVLQETLLVAARRIGVFRGTSEQALATWLAALARRKLIDLARHNGRLKRALKRQSSLEELGVGNSGWFPSAHPIDPCTASQVAVKQELSTKLTEAMARMDRREAEVLWLRYVDGMSLEGIGRHMGVGRHGASGIVSRALRNLRRLFPIG
jgi:RNA polymerase sigma-70 factor (ECF subfamily)